MTRSETRFAPTGARSIARATIVGLTAAVALLSGLGASNALAAEPKLLMLPIVVHSAEDPEYLRAGLSDMLAARFERLGAIELLRGDADERGTTDVDKAFKLARKAGADYVLYGSFTRFGQGASLDVQCAPVPGAAGEEREPLREIFVHSGSIGEIIPDLDELAGKVSRFARGEAVGTTAPAAVGPGAVAAPTGAIRDLVFRVEALEAAIAQMLESAEDTAGNAGADAELR